MTKKKEKSSPEDHSFDVGGRDGPPAKLPEQVARKLFFCWYEDKLTAEETAERLGLDVAVVRFHFAFINKALAEMEKKDGELP
jgi:hypothetical protein